MIVSVTEAQKRNLPNLSKKKVKSQSSKRTKAKIKKQTKNKTTKLNIPENRPLTPKQELFCYYYLETGNGQQSAIRAGYAEKTARITASRLLTYDNVKKKIRESMEETKKNSIATAQEVMEYFTKVMNGEIKDQFNLDAPLSERTRAAQELAKRTVDIENRANGKADAVVQIKLDWTR